MRGASEPPVTSKGSRAAGLRPARMSTEAANPAAWAVARACRRPRPLVHHVDRADYCDVGTLLGAGGPRCQCVGETTGFRQSELSSLLARMTAKRAPPSSEPTKRTPRKPGLAGSESDSETGLIGRVSERR